MLNMDNLADYLLDLIQNSIRAEAKLITLSIELDQMLKVVIKDNGKGMSKELLALVDSPFYTTRTTRKVGLGLPLIKMLTEQTDGSFLIESKLGYGTSLTLNFNPLSIDMPLIGNLGELIYTIIIHQDVKEFIFVYKVKEKKVTFKKSKLTEIFKETLFDYPVIQALIEYMNQEINQVRGAV